VTSCCATEKDIYTLVKNFILLSILKKMTFLTIVFSANVNFQQLYVFAMNNKASPPSTDPTKKCRDLFPYLPSLDSRLALLQGPCFFAHLSFGRDYEEVSVSPSGVEQGDSAPER
jgi:hypothetical protein